MFSSFQAPGIPESGETEGWLLLLHCDTLEAVAQLPISPYEHQGTEGWKQSTHELYFSPPVLLHCFWVGVKSQLNTRSLLTLPRQANLSMPALRKKWKISALLSLAYSTLLGVIRITCCFFWVEDRWQTPYTVCQYYLSYQKNQGTT